MNVNRALGPAVLVIFAIALLLSRGRYLDIFFTSHTILLVIPSGLGLIIFILIKNRIKKKIDLLKIQNDVVVIKNGEKLIASVPYKLSIRERGSQSRIDYANEIEALGRVLSRAFPDLLLTIVTQLENRPNTLLIASCEGKSEEQLRRRLKEFGEFLITVKDSIAPDIEMNSMRSSRALVVPLGDGGDAVFLKVYGSVPALPNSRGYSIGFDIELGKANDGYDTPVGLRKEELLRHVAIFGTTGSGKTNTAGLIAAGAAKLGFRTVIVDWHGEYSALLKDAEKWDVKRPLKLKLFQEDDDLEEVVQVLGEALDLTEPQRFLLLTILNLVRKKSRERVFDAVVRAEENSYWIRDVKYALARKLYTISTPKADILFSDGEGVEWRDILKCLKGINVIDLSLVNNLILRKVYVLFLLRFLTEAHLRNWDGKTTIVVLEEAHNYLKEDNPFIERMMSEMRKFNLGICVVSQSPSTIAPCVIKNTNTKLVHALKSNVDKSVVRDSMALDEKFTSALDKLRVGEALLSSPTLPYPVSLRVKKG
ncbi:ATP-binding protein [Sulfodiicoccus acidiphilus]|nr:DUF87 domain-containing protein [Sulfodiicoccus acidiphilus]